jgi:hypothetical protein
MYNLKAPPFATESTRAFLKNYYKKIYSLCRFFADDYKEHQRLFADIIAATVQSIRRSGANEEKDTLLLQACINMAALHSITRDLETSAGTVPDGERTIQFKSPDYQKGMVKFRDAMGPLSDYQKILLFLSFENVRAAEISRLSGIRAADRKRPEEQAKKSFIPYLKEKLIWS